MEGGIRAWQGMVAHGIPEAGMAYFSPAANAEELVGLAWSLEEGSKIFYQGVAEHFADDSEAHKLFTWLVNTRAIARINAPRGITILGPKRS